MLNTSLHNRNVKNPLTMEGFVSLYRGIDEGKDVPKELLEVSEFSLTCMLHYFLFNYAGLLHFVYLVKFPHIFNFEICHLTELEAVGKR